METKDEAGGPVPLAPRPTSHPLVRILQKLGLRTLAWVGVYLLGYFDFSLGWMVTPLLLSVLRCPVVIVTILVITVIILSSSLLYSSPAQGSLEEGEERQVGSCQGSRSLK